MFFTSKSSKRYQFQNIKLCPTVAAIYFQLNTVKGTAVELVSLNDIRGTKTAFETPKNYGRHSRSLYMRVPREKQKTLEYLEYLRNTKICENLVGSFGELSSV